MVANAAFIIRENLVKPSHAGLSRARNYLDSAKRWLISVDSLLSDYVYVDRLNKAIRASSVDPDVLEIEYFPNKNVIFVHGAFDIDELRKYVLTV